VRRSLLSAAGAATAAALAGLGLLLPGPAALARARSANWAPRIFSARMSHRFGKTGELFSSPAVGHVCGAPGSLQVVTGNMDGVVRWWTIDNPNGGRWCRGSFYTGPGAVESSPVLYDFTHNGYQDILVANTAGSYRHRTSRGRVVVFAPHMGNKVLFSKYTGDSHHHIPGDFATPVVYDLNGHPDIIETSWDTHLYAWDEVTGRNLHGSPFWLPDTSWSSPTIARINGVPQIFFGDDCAGVRGQPCHPRHGGYLYDVRWMHHRLTRKWRIFLNGETVWSSPAVAQLRPKGPLSVVVGTGNMPCTVHTGMCGGRHVYAFNANTGRRLSGWPVNTGGTVTSSPAVANLGIGRRGMQVAVVDSDGWLDVFGSGGGQPVWKKCLPRLFHQRCTARNGYHQSVSIAAINGQQDIVVSVGQHIVVFSGSGRTWRYNLAYLTNRTSCSSRVFGPFSAAPTIVSLGGTATVFDNAYCSAVGGGWRAGLFEWNLHAGFDSNRASWPTFKRSFNRDAVLR
jgi:hypothetical protein